MEVKIEESEQSKFQAKQNQTGIPFPHWASRPDGEAHLYSVPIVRGMSLSRSRLSCQGVDGECMRTRLMKLSEKEDTK